MLALKLPGFQFPSSSDESLWTIALARVVQAADDQIRRYTLPIIHQHADGSVGVTGSSTILQIAGKYFLLTAEHVFADRRPFGTLVPAADGRRPEFIGMTGEVLAQSAMDAKGRDRIDVAAMLLDDETAVAFARAPVLTLADVDVEIRPEDLGRPRELPALYGFIGYPGALNRRFRKRQSRPFERAAYWFNVAPVSQYKAVESTIATHIVCDNSKPTFDMATGRHATPVKPHGISGGPVWRAQISTDGVLSLHFVAIAIERHLQPAVFVATRVWIACDLIRELCPEVAAYLPRCPTLA